MKPKRPKMMVVQKMNFNQISLLALKRRLLYHYQHYECLYASVS